MAAKASHSRVRAWVPNPLANATQGCASGLYALVERSNALTIRDLESMRARRPTSMKFGAMVRATRQRRRAKRCAIGLFHRYSAQARKSTY